MTDQGIGFVDSYTALEIDVVDAGIIRIPADGIYAFKTRAREAGLDVREESIH